MRSREDKPENLASDGSTRDMTEIELFPGHCEDVVTEAPASTLGNIYSGLQSARLFFTQTLTNSVETAKDSVTDKISPKKTSNQNK